MKTFTLVLAASLVSALWAAPVPKEKPAPFDPSGTWVTFSLSDEGQPFEGRKGNDLFQSRFEFKLSDKSAVLTLKSGRTASYTIGRLTQAVKSCRFECVSDCSPVYMRRFRVLCKREGDVLLLSLIDKYDNDRCYAVDGLCTVLQAQKMSLEREFCDPELSKLVYKTHQLRNT